MCQLSRFLIFFYNIFILEYCMSPKCYFKDFQSDYARQKYIVLPPYHSLSISQEVVLPCLANRQVTTYQSYSCNIDGRFEPPLSEKVCDESTSKKSLKLLLFLCTAFFHALFFFFLCVCVYFIL